MEKGEKTHPNLARAANSNTCGSKLELHITTIYLQADGPAAQGGVPRHVHVPAADEHGRQSPQERDRRAALRQLGLLRLQHAQVHQQPQPAAAIQVINSYFYLLRSEQVKV